MTNATAPKPLSRVLNAIVAAAISIFLLASYWPMLQLFNLSRADLEYQGVWVDGHAKRITALTPGGVADRAGLRVGDVLQFDAAREADWVLAGYRQVPEGFSAALQVRHADGSSTRVGVVPEHVAYLPTLNDRLALVARLSAGSIALLLGVVVIWARPGLMAWCFFLAMTFAFPLKVWVDFAIVFDAGYRIALAPVLTIFVGMSIAFLPFALCFPRNTLVGWSWSMRILGVLAVLAWWAFLQRSRVDIVPFQKDWSSKSATLVFAAVTLFSLLGALIVLLRTFRRSAGDERARLKWAVLGMAAALAAQVLTVVFFAVPFFLTNSLSGSGATPLHWALTLVYGLLWPLALGNAILRQRVVDVQFAISRTLVYGAVSTLAVALVATLDWLLGRMIEHSGLTLGLAGTAAIGLGLVLHRLTHGINGLVDRLLFRRHHQAEQRLRRVIAALPFASAERSIAEALVLEPTRNLLLASAALFYRDSPVGPLRRVLAHGWGEEHAATLDADAMLVRYLQAEHQPLWLDDPQWLAADFPTGVEAPVLAIPLINQHALTALVLYSGHCNSSLPDPDEVELLQALAKAAAASHQQVRIALLTRRNEQLEAATAELRALVQVKWEVK